MSVKQRKALRMKWPVIWLIQIISMLALGALIALGYYLGPVVHGILIWGVMSIAGAASACLATVRGLLNYAAWIAPPAMALLGHILVWGYLPGMGPIFLCAFISLVGAATGEVIKRQQDHRQTKEKRSKTWKRT